MDEHEALIEYSEMTSFDFNSEEFQKVRKDFIECRYVVTNIFQFVKNVVDCVKSPTKER